MMNLFLLLAVMLGLIVGLAAASTVDSIKLKASYKLGYWRGLKRSSHHNVKIHKEWNSPDDCRKLRRE